MSRADTIRWGRGNFGGIRPLMMMEHAVSDYISSRCLYWNNLVENSFVLAAQSLEKLLKCEIALSSPNKVKHTHNIEKLLKDARNLTLTQEEKEFALHMANAYIMGRYPDQMKKIGLERFSLGWEHLNQLDYLFLKIFDNLLLPNEVRFRSTLYNYLFFNDNSYRKEKYWLLHENTPLNHRLSEMHRQHSAIKLFHYGEDIL